MKHALKQFAWLAALAAPLAWAHGDATGHAPAHAAMQEQKPFGIAGDPKRARTITVRMDDNMRFTPERIEVREGETIRFVVRNGGGVLHEMVIGSEAELREHAALMQKFPGMEHEEAFMTHVKPGARGAIVWNFNRPGTFQFACLLPGHYEAGMKGTLVVLPMARKP